MKRTKTAIVTGPGDKPCSGCVNTFRACPMQIVLALSRVPDEMEITVVNCPERRVADPA
jgi:hypothetical protein